MDCHDRNSLSLRKEIRSSLTRTRNEHKVNKSSVARCIMSMRGLDGAVRRVRFASAPIVASVCMLLATMGWSAVAGATEPAFPAETVESNHLANVPVAEGPARLTLLVLPYGYGERSWGRPRADWQPRQRWVRPYWRDDWRWRNAPDRSYGPSAWRRDYDRPHGSWRDRDWRWSERDGWRRQHLGRYGYDGRPHSDWRGVGRYDRDRW